MPYNNISIIMLNILIVILLYPSQICLIRKKIFFFIVYFLFLIVYKGQIQKTDMKKNIFIVLYKQDHILTIIQNSNDKKIIGKIINLESKELKNTSLPALEVFGRIRRGERGAEQILKNLQKKKERKKLTDILLSHTVTSILL